MKNLVSNISAVSRLIDESVPRQSRGLPLEINPLEDVFEDMNDGDEAYESEENY
jgi:hypothetical protein